MEETGEDRSSIKTASRSCRSRVRLSKKARGRPLLQLSCSSQRKPAPRKRRGSGSPQATASKAGRKHLPPGKHPRRQRIQAAEKALFCFKERGGKQRARLPAGHQGAFPTGQPGGDRQIHLPTATGARGAFAAGYPYRKKTPRSCGPPPASSGELFPSITRMKHKSPSQRTMKRNTAEKRAAGALHVIEELQKHLDPWLSHDSGERPRQKYCYTTE